MYRFRARSRRLTVLLLAGLLPGVLATIALATSASGVTSTPIAQGSLDQITSKSKFGDWEAEIETKGQTNLVVVENRVAPGGHFGWHSHPGPSLVIVKSGTATFYRGDDPACTPTVYEQGDAFADPAGGVVHIVRNEGSAELVVIATRLLPAGAPARIDEPDPGNCDF
jgi:quercetin dioxygenase-like cupin family protein